MKFPANLGKPFAVTGKSKIYFYKSPDGTNVVFKQLTSRAEPWQSLFRNEMRVGRKLKSSELARHSPRLLGVDMHRKISGWEHAEGKSSGVGRYFSGKIKDKDCKAILKVVEKVGRILPPPKDGYRFSHGDLVCSNLLLSQDKVVLVDWEHAGMRPAYYDLAFLWVMGLFAPALRNDVLRQIKGKAALAAFWTLVASILSKEIRLHKNLRANSKYRSERPLGEIRHRLQILLRSVKKKAIFGSD